MSPMHWEADSTSYIPAFLTKTRHSAFNRQRPANEARVQDRGLSLVLINLSKLCETFLVLTVWLLVESVLMDEFLKLKGVQDLPPQNMQNWILFCAASTWDSAHLERALRPPSFCLTAGHPVSREKGALSGPGKAKHPYSCQNGPGHTHLLK